MGLCPYRARLIIGGRYSRPSRPGYHITGFQPCSADHNTAVSEKALLGEGVRFVVPARRLKSRYDKFTACIRFVSHPIDAQSYANRPAWQTKKGLKSGKRENGKAGKRKPYGFDAN